MNQNLDNFNEITECGVCHTKEYTAFLKDGIFSINKCSQCTTHWVTPRLKPEKLKDIYQTIYWKSDSPKDLGYDDYLRQDKLYQKTFSRRFKNLIPFLSKLTTTQKKVLDIGCSNGVFLSMMQKKGWKGVGLDISEYIIEQAQKTRAHEDLEFRSGYLHEKVAEKEKFNLITMWDVIEHVEDPIGILKQINVRLNPGGLLVLETQNINSFFAKLLKRSWHHFKHFEHIYHFNETALRNMLENTGFNIKSISTANSGKYIEGKFLIERSQRVLPKFLHGLVKTCLGGFQHTTFYANMHDEYIIVAEKTE